MTQDITSLIEKLEGAEVGSAALDHEIARLFGWTQENIWRDPTFRNGDWYGPDSYVPQRCPPSCTTSLDAALVLAERVLPSSPEPGDVPWDQWLIELTRSPVWRREVRVTWDCSIGNGLGFGGARVTSIATPALALCVAILRAQSEAH